MQILHISDTHGSHKLLTNLPKADIIIHSDDASFSGSDDEILDFLNWFCDLDYAHKIFVAGNHDDCLYGEQIEGLPDNCHYLCCSGIEFEGLRFWGVPLFMGDILKKGRMEEIMKEIPNDTDVLISHNPPFGILDFDDGMNYGCRILLEAVERVNPFYHFFGHIHAANGVETINKTTFVNSAIMNEKYEFVNKPRLFITDELQNVLIQSLNK
ncbi:metallophosphoesterase [Bacteroides sp. 224]|uniref:metallophosphoesterase family protein n=1 Tax=Bacteroides sp. 224 TaxID=2302936 RepID=UPI0013D16AFE|nr:metallophosphatase domain-containing protein [Bacteroides sp. 224]NDV65146.1 serine/threonine protein phosphatase [Bacteroides sp. 224]